MYKAVTNQPDFPFIEKDVLNTWETQSTFQKSMENRKGADEFVFYDGPPFATGLPHYGHLLAGTIKDIVPRYLTMRGHYVDRRFGWDCHGLPVEYEVEQNLGISGKSDIEKMGVDVFNEQCRSIVLRYTEEWRETVTRMGRWVDFDRDYKTMDPEYMESIWAVFKMLWDKELIYEGHKILPYCPRCATPLSNFETNQGYRDVTDPAITVRFKIDDEPNTYILAWTTTPWTLPSNLALAVGNDIEYVRVEEKDETYYLARSRLAAYYASEDGYVSLRSVAGRDLVGITYEPLFPYFKSEKARGAFRVMAADFVSTEDGTGVVHIAPGFGEDDAKLGSEVGLMAVCPVDAEGKFESPVDDYVGRDVKESDADIIKHLKKKGVLIDQRQLKHSYPHCWRCDTALIYRSISTWFVKVEAIKDRLIAANQSVHWVPSHLHEGRFGKWLEGARDWAISRNRYWGCPLPLWRSDDNNEVMCIGSIAELEELTGKQVRDLHKHYIDTLELPSCSGSGVLRRVPEVLDCWFESGAMPYAQNHYPFENKEHFESHFPADFIAEGLDQTRGWFYTLMVLSVALFDRPAFRNVVVNGMVLAEDGRKMSKRLKNYPDPTYMLDRYGADALRLYMIFSPVVRAEDLRFSESGVKQLLRNILLPMWNAYSFFVTYANVDNWEGGPDHGRSSNVLDRWIISSMETLLARVVIAMDAYDLQRAVRPFVHFIEDLTNWYIRRSRRRFWKSEDDEDKEQAYRTLYYVLLQLTKVTAPFIPCLSDSIYMNLRTSDMPESVHLCDFPEADAENRDEELESQMADVMTVVKLGRLLRSENNIRVRQPLQSMHVVSRNTFVLEHLKKLECIVTDELNIRAVAFGEHETEFATLTAKPEFKKLGPRLGPQVKEAARVLANLQSEALEPLAAGESITIQVNDENVVLASSDVVLERVPREGLVVAAEAEIVVGLEIALNNELIRDGLAREFVNRVQNMRKNSGFAVADRIRVTVSCDSQLRDAIESHLDYVNSEVLSTDTSFSINAPAESQEWDIDGRICKIHVVKVS